MEKKAILIKGEPTMVDNLEEFKTNSKRNIGLMTEIAAAEGYDVQYTSLKQMIKTIKRSANLDKFLFYFTGHANEENIGNFNYRTADVLEAMKEISGDKLIVLDACAGMYKGKGDFEAFDLPLVVKRARVSLICF